MFYSQFGEDRILSRIFRGKRRGACIEVGANDGVHGSTSLHFEGLGWRCILIEPNPELCREIRARRKAELFECAASDQPGALTLHVAQGAWRADGMSTVSDRPEDHARIRQQGFQTHPIHVRADTLDAILSRGRDSAGAGFHQHRRRRARAAGARRFFDRSLAADGADHRRQFRERPTHAIGDYLGRYGYVRFRRTGVNDWYAHRSNKRLVNLASRSCLALKLLAIRGKRRLRAAGVLRDARPRAGSSNP